MHMFQNESECLIKLYFLTILILVYNTDTGTRLLPFVFENVFLESTYILIIRASAKCWTKIMLENVLLKDNHFDFFALLKRV